MSESPSPDDSVLSALRKLFPQSPGEVLEPAAAWLRDNFGMMEYADLEGIKPMADTAISVVATDASVGASAKQVLDTLLRRLAGLEIGFGAAAPAGGCAAAVLVPSPAGNEGSTVFKPAVVAACPDDPLPEALRKLFPLTTPEVLGHAADWQSQSFGVAEYADLEGVKSMADAAIGLLSGDSNLSEEAKDVIGQCLRGRLPEHDDVAQHVITPQSPCSPPSSSPPPSLRSAGASRRDDFILVRPLGEGSFAKVHKVTERSTGCHFALKEILRVSEDDKASREKIDREMTVHKSLKHAHVLKCCESFDKCGIQFMLLELAEGGDLYQRLQREKTLKEAQAARLLADVTAGLHYIHLMGWMHRDIKPENIFLDADDRAKLGDFGECADISTTQTLECGSPAYFAPEMCAGSGYDCRIDIWALGILLYEMLSGSWPFPLALTLNATREKVLKMEFRDGAWINVPIDAQPLIKSILRRDAADRLTSLEILSNEWLTLLAGSEQHAAAAALEREHEEAREARSSLTLALEDLKVSIDVSEMKGVLRRAVAYGMEKHPLFCTLRDRYESLKMQVRRRDDLLRCAYQSSKTDIKKLLLSLAAEGLDLPGGWLLADGPKLYALAEKWLLELEMGQLGSNYSAMETPLDFEAPCPEGYSLKDDDYALVRVYRNWRLEEIKAMMSVPSMRVVASDDIAKILVERCDRLLIEVRAHRALQFCIAGSDAEDIRRTVAELEEDGLHMAGGWLLSDGPHLLGLAASRQQELESEKERQDRALAEAEERGREALSSSCVQTIRDAIANLHAYSVEGDQAKALQERYQALDAQQTLLEGLKRGLASDKLAELDCAISAARDGGLDCPEAWLLNGGPEAFAVANKRVKQAASITSSIEEAISALDAGGLQVALDDADSLGLQLRGHEHARELLMKLQDPVYVHTKLAELAGSDESKAKMLFDHLRNLHSGDDSFTSADCLPPDRGRLDLVLERMRAMDCGFPVQLRCVEFLRSYELLVPAVERRQVANSHPLGGVSARVARLVAWLPKLSCEGQAIKPEDMNVTSSHILMSAGLHVALETALQRCCWKPATKIQAAWRGCCSREAVGAPVREAMALNRLLRQAAESVDGPLRQTAISAEALEDALLAFEDLLRKAARLQWTLPCFKEYLEARTRLAQRAGVARCLADRLFFASATEAEALAARAAACGLEGPLPQSMARRATQLRSQLHRRMLLRAAAVETDPATVEAALAAAKEEGLDSHDKWVIDGGIESFVAARARAQELRDTISKKVSVAESLERELSVATISLDTAEMQSIINRAEAHGSVVVSHEQLRGRCSAVRRQESVLAELRGCVRSDQAEHVAGVLSRVKEAGLDAPAAWLLPDGPRVLARAQCWVDQLRREAKACSDARAQMERQIGVLQCSFDTEAIAACLECARRAGVQRGVVEVLEARRSALCSQAVLCNSLRLSTMRSEGSTHALRTVAEAGLGPSTAGWVEPDGPRLVARATLWQSLIAEVGQMEKPSDQTLRAAVMALEECLTSEKIEDLERAFAEAKRLGLDSPRTWQRASVRPCVAIMAAASCRLAVLDEQQANVCYAPADLDWQARRLRSLLSGSGARWLLEQAQIDFVGKRSGELRRQLPHCKALLCAALEGDKSVAKTLSDVKAAGLDKQEAWLLPEGPALVASAERRLFRVSQAATCG